MIESRGSGSWTPTPTGSEFAGKQTQLRRVRVCSADNFGTDVCDSASTAAAAVAFSDVATATGHRACARTHARTRTLMRALAQTHTDTEHEHRHRLGVSPLRPSRRLSQRGFLQPGQHARSLGLPPSALARLLSPVARCLSLAGCSLARLLVLTFVARLHCLGSLTLLSLYLRLARAQ